MNPSFWTLAYLPTGIEKTFAQWGISSDAARNINNAATDEFTFSIDERRIDEEPPFAAEQTCIIKRNGVRYFYGRVVALPSNATPQRESIRYTLAGLWWYLDHKTFQQTWNINTTPLTGVTIIGQPRPRTILYQKIDGTFFTVSEQITQIAQYCVNQGAPFVLGTIDPSDAKPPTQEVKDVTCGEAIRTCLRWAPDAVAWFDYSVDPPQLHIRQRSALSKTTVSMAGAPASGLSINPRYDLRASGVKIIYEITTSVNDATWVTPQEDTAGDPTGFKGINLSIEMSGASLTVQRQELTVATLDFRERATWESFHPFLKQATDVTISDVRINNGLLPGQTADTTDTTSNYDKLAVKDFSGAQLPEFPLADPLVKVLTAGQVPNWLTDDFVDGVATAKFSYTLTNPDTSAKAKWVKTPYNAKIKLTTLAAGTNTYQNITAFTPAEPIPVGLAAAYYAAISVLHYEGTWETTAEEVLGDISVGQVINIEGASAPLATMDALVQSISEQLGTGHTSIAFGPPAHLTPQDFIELQRVQRTRVPTRRLQERVDGKYYGGGGQVDGAQQVPQGHAAGSTVPGQQLRLQSAP